MLRPEVKEQWCGALRGGEYTQGNGHLYNPEGHYCCLGVLAEECGAFGVSFSNSERVLDHLDGVLPDPLMEDLGLSQEASDHLIVMNDKGRKSFDEIADWIEGNL